MKAGESGRSAFDDDVQYNEFPLHERDYVDRTTYRVVHFHGSRLADSLARAAEFLLQLEKRMSREPHALCMTAQYSWEDEATDLAWRVTVVLGQPMLNGGAT